MQGLQNRSCPQVTKALYIVQSAFAFRNFAYVNKALDFNVTVNDRIKIMLIRRRLDIRTLLT